MEGEASPAHFPGASPEEPEDPHEDQNKYANAADKFDENGEIDMSELLDENGNPIKNYPLPSDARDRRAEFENTIMRAYMTKKALDEGTEPPPRKYQSEATPSHVMMMRLSLPDRCCHSSIGNSMSGVTATGTGTSGCEPGRKLAHRAACGSSTKHMTVSVVRPCDPSTRPGICSLLLCPSNQ